jgi:heavy metal translocating P-type ATPase
MVAHCNDDTISSLAQHCDYCALPILNSAAAQANSSEPSYCCYGCRFAAAMAGETANPADLGGAQLRLGLAIFFAMNIMVFTMFLWSQPEATPSPAAAIMYDIARYVCLLFSLPVLFLLGPSLLVDALAGIKTGKIESSLLLLIGVGASFAYSAFSVFQGHGHVYFEVGVVVLVAVTLGRWLEAQGKLRTTQALRELQTLLPTTVRRFMANQETMIPLAEVGVGDVLRVLPGERIAVDGTISRGRAAIDEQMVTGESMPVEKQSGDEVRSGTLNIDGELLIVTSAAPHAGTLQRLIDAVTNAVAQQTAYQRLADAVAAWFLPAIMFFAILTFGVHYFRNQSLENGILAALAVVVISCPCALGLATPLALWAAIGRAAKKQVLFRHGDALARLAEAKVICFDKTGTLTTGLVAVDEVWSAQPANRQQVLRVAGAIAQCSNHPVAKSVAAFTSSDRQEHLNWNSAQELPGRGILAACDELAGEVRLGNLRWLQECGIRCEAWDAMEQQAVWQSRSVTWIAWNGELQGAFALREELRPEAASTIAALKQLGLKIVLLTGDRAHRANALAAPLEIEVAADLLPTQKLERVAQLRREVGAVVMVGDGLNDAPALAAADIGIALGCGADLARDVAGVCLLGNRLDLIPWSLALAREANHTIRWNLFWAFAYNIAGIPLAALGMVNPIVAAIAMAVSSVFVTTNSLRLTHEQNSQVPNASPTTMETWEVKESLAA